MPAHWWDRLWLNFLTYELIAGDQVSRPKKNLTVQAMLGKGGPSLAQVELSRSHCQVDGDRNPVTES